MWERCHPDHACLGNPRIETEDALINAPAHLKEYQYCVFENNNTQAIIDATDSWFDRADVIDKIIFNQVYPFRSDEIQEKWKKAFVETIKGDEKLETYYAEALDALIPIAGFIQFKMGLLKPVED